MKYSTPVLSLLMLLLSSIVLAQQPKSFFNMPTGEKLFHTSIKRSGLFHTGNAVYKEPVFPANCYYAHLGFFCREEVKFQNAHVPLSFRIGNLEQCNTLEQKPGYVLWNK